MTSTRGEMKFVRQQKKYFLVEKKEIGELYKNVIQGSCFTTLLG